jgi:hypothetical protein
MDHARSTSSTVCKVGIFTPRQARAAEAALELVWATGERLRIDSGDAALVGKSDPPV